MSLLEDVLQLTKLVYFFQPPARVINVFNKDVKSATFLFSNILLIFNCYLDKVQTTFGVQFYKVQSFVATVLYLLYDLAFLSSYI